MHGVAENFDQNKAISIQSNYDFYDFGQISHTYSLIRRLTCSVSLFDVYRSSRDIGAFLTAESRVPKFRPEEPIRLVGNFLVMVGILIIPCTHRS